MTIIQLMERARRFPIFRLEDCQKWFPRAKRGTLLLQLSNYVRRGYLRRLRRGLYLLNDLPAPHPLAVASRLKPEAVISLETVLSAAGILPDTALAVTAVTAQRSGRYVIPAAGGVFIFRHIQPALLFGWRLEQFPPYAARVAYPEKALLDLFWFHQREKDFASYLEGLRLSFPADFSWQRFRACARLFPNLRFQDMTRAVERRFNR